jgi:FlaA1/EpsC-like NDP-sugar epimerase
MIEKILGREMSLFSSDIDDLQQELVDLVKGAKVLIIGAAGTIGSATAKQIFQRNPSALHAVDISENNLVELVRYIRSSVGYQDVDFRTFAIDCGSDEFEAFVKFHGPYDYVFNLSALKHVRSESDPYTLMRLVQVNIFNTVNTLRQTSSKSLKKYFCVSTDKAANPVNMMGASKLIMEMFLQRESMQQSISMARFANVAFSDGSLLHGFNQRFLNQQPIAAPNDILRYFITPSESGELCLLSGLLGQNREIFFPKLTNDFKLIDFSDIARSYVEEKGYKVFECGSEEEARKDGKKLIDSGYWPCYFFKSDTTGEKDVETFFTDKESLDLDRFNSLGVILNDHKVNSNNLDEFWLSIMALKKDKAWGKGDILELFNTLLPTFDHMEKGKYLDNKM